MNVSTLASTAGGTYPLTITATSGALVHTASATLIVTAPNFSVGVSPSSQSVVQGGAVNYNVTITASGGFTGNVGFSVSGLPTGASATFTPTSVAGSGTSVMNVSTLASTAGGTYPLTITATSGPWCTRLRRPWLSQRPRTFPLQFPRHHKQSE